MLLPGRPRHLEYTGNAVTEQGDFALEYTYLDKVLLPLDEAGRYPPDITDLDTYRADESATGKAHLDAVARPVDLPDYIVPLLERTLALRSYGNTLQMRSYYKFFKKDTLELSVVFVDSINVLLEQPGYYQTPGYIGLQESLAMYAGESTYQSASASANNYAAITAGYLTGDYPAANRRHDAVASFLVRTITDPRVYSGKMENIDTLRQTLPAGHQAKLTKIEAAAIARSAGDNGFPEFLSTPLANPAGAFVQPAELTDKPLRLYKFWFAGCYPCLVQQPFEAALLAKYPQVELIYVVHNTAPDDWQSYLTMHTPPAGHQLYTDGNQIGLVKSAAGTTGAPTYVMADKDGELVCRPCPKPSDELLGEMIERATGR